MITNQQLKSLTTEELISIINDLQEKINLQQYRDGELKSKHTIKDSVFTNLFKDVSYTFKMYQALHPEDTVTTIDNIEIVTIESHLVNQLYNDLGFLVGDRLIILIEHQSTWSINIVIRIFWYIADTWHKYVKIKELDVYGTEKITLPKPELYVIYTGERKDKQDKISLKDDIFGGEDIGINLEVKVVYDGQEGDIINQYVTFCKVLSEQIKINGRSEKAVRETIRICCDRDILREYLEHQEKEIVNIMMTLFDEETALRSSYASAERRGIEIGERRGIEIGEKRGIEIGERRGRNAGKAEGEQKATVNSIKNIMKSLHCSAEKAMDIIMVPQEQRSMYAGLAENS